MSKTGRIIKGIGGFYYVKAGNEIIECRARGKFRKDMLMPYVGDFVEIDDGYVMKILPRKNKFIRPPITNIDKLIIVSAADNPKPDFLFIDKMIVTALSCGVDIALCFNKSDLNEDVHEYADIYSKSGFNVFVTSTKENSGIEELRDFMRGSVSVLCGFSGVGKSSLINLLIDNYRFEVGEVSLKLNRGKHTTRHVELVEYELDSFFADTPGFSMLTLPESIEASKLIECFPDLKKYSYDCRFSDCNHTSGKFCSVHDALSDGKIVRSRYENYVTLYNTLKDNKEWK